MTHRTPDPKAVPFDALLGWAATTPHDPTPPASKPVEAFKGFIASVLMGALVAGLLLPWVTFTSSSVNAAVAYWNDLPTELPSKSLPRRSVILAADGTKIGEFYSENRVLVTLKEVPQHLIDAVIAIEDSRFYTHHGVDWRGIGRAVVSNVLTDSTQGGSTITQQYVKQVLLDAATTETERDAATSRTSYTRKLREARYAMELEDTLTKNQILEGYLNIAYFGDGSYGVGAAAEHYFNKPVADLTLAESATLAGIVRNPTGYDPTNHKATAKNRRNLVLGRMQTLGTITKSQYKRARKTPITLDVTTPANGCHDSRYPFYCQWVKNQLENDPVFGQTPEARQQRLFRGGMTIHTALDPAAQKTAQQAVDSALGRENRVASAVAVVKPGTGDVVALATNRTFGTPKPGHFDKTEVILPVQPAFQPGSTFKPFTLASALEHGYPLTDTWNAPQVYAPTGFRYPNTGFTNSGSGEDGMMNAATALWRSSNTWFVHLETEVGVLNVADTARRLGITSLPTKGPTAITAADASLTLGTYEVSPLDMASAYATLAAHGVACKPTGITRITGPDQRQIDVPDPACHQAIDPGVADTVANVMVGTITGPDPVRTGEGLGIGRPAAGKTGTTQNNAAVWFNGFTPQYATAVWVGDPRGGFGHPLQGFTAYGRYYSRAYGGDVAGPIWQNVMTGLHTTQPVEEFAPVNPVAASGYQPVVPQLAGLPLAAAVNVLQQAGYVATIARTTAKPDPDLPAGVVESSTPAVGTAIPAGTTITLTATAGTNTHVRIPNTTTEAPPFDKKPQRGQGPHDHGGGVLSRR